MNLELHIFNFLYLFFGITSLGLGLFVWIRSYKKKPNIFFFLTTASFCIFSIAYILASNEVDPIKSRFYLLFTLVNIFTVIFNAHTAFAMFNKLESQKWGLRSVYISGIVLFLFFLSDTSRYLGLSRPYQYFPNFYNPGPYYWLFILYFVAVAIYFLTIIAFDYNKSDSITKKRIVYFLSSFGLAYALGFIGFLPMFGVNADIFLSVFIGLYLIPLAYGILKYELIDINVFAKKAFQYAVTTSFVGTTIIGVNFLNNYLIENYPGFPIWIIPFLSGVLVVGVAVYVWNQIREVDRLKYEFINNISHKFRTPLTHIRWMAEELRTEQDQKNRNKFVDEIQYGSMRLFELTNIVMDVAKNDMDDNFYRLTPINIYEMLLSLQSLHADQIARKKLGFEIVQHGEVKLIPADRTRIQFALQILIENALIYTPDGGNITISILTTKYECSIAFKDSGIGIDPSEIPFLFSKFYRTANARHEDTEGMGIGLYIAKNIIEKHHGTIKAISAGINKGSTFIVSLPVEQIQKQH